MGSDIAIFGGTFDPVHHGHLIIARAVAEKMGFSRITLLPTAIPPHKRPAAASPQDRLEMLRLATRGDELFDICEIELCRHGPSFTIDTLMELGRHYGDDARLHLIVGMDMLADLHHWRKAQQVVQVAQIITAARPPFQDRLEGVLHELSGHFDADAINKIKQGIVATPLIEISSSQIRRRVCHRLPIRYLTPVSVEGYILERKLYVLDEPGVGGGICKKSSGGA